MSHETPPGMTPSDVAAAADRIRRSIGEHLEQRPEENERLTFDAYLARVIERPHIADLAHARIYHMIMSHGLDGQGRYRFFRDELFGLDEPIEQVVAYFRAGAQRLETRKRILLLRGPVSSAKSTLVDLLKEGLAAYSHTDPGAVYGIDGCPMNEEPLHVLPPKLRAEMQEDHGLHIEGQLCPVCNHRLQHEFDGDFMRFSVRRIYLSEQDRTGIGTFLPSDPKSQDISELVGSINFAKIGETGVESHPEAYSFDGELNIANRGLMEFIEMLKADEKFLYVLLTLTQEQVIKAPRFPRIYADVCLLAHTNESEYNDFVSDKRGEALQDRIIVVDFPYNLSVTQEERIYHKLIARTKTSKHMAPYALRVASMLAVLSRLEPEEDPKLDLVSKMRLYDGQRIGRWGPSDLARIHERNVREGMDGISPRYVVNRISSALIQEDEPCLTPERTLYELRAGLKSHPRFSAADRERYAELVALVYEAYAHDAERQVRDAILRGQEPEVTRLFRTYMTHVAAYATGGSVAADAGVLGHARDTGASAGKGTSGTTAGAPGALETGSAVSLPDEAFMRSVEKRVGIREPAKDSYRRQLLAKMEAMERDGRVFDHRADGPLKKAIDELVFEDNKHKVRSITTLRAFDDESRAEIDRTKERLVADHGHCAHCAEALLRFVGTHHSAASNASKEAALPGRGSTPEGA